MSVYILLCDSEVSTFYGTMKAKATYLNTFTNMFQAQRAIVEYYLPPNLNRIPHKEEEKLRPKNAICNQIYESRDRNSTYHFYVIVVDLEEQKEDKNLI